MSPLGKLLISFAEEYQGKLRIDLHLIDERLAYLGISQKEAFIVAKALGLIPGKFWN